MHPRNRFKTIKPDFGAYASTRPSFKPYLIALEDEKSRYTLDFKNPLALRELLCACLEHEFDLKVEIPLDHLIPTIPSRLNYIHWIEDLLTDKGGSHPIGDGIMGVDIGTGPCCIYPLLGRKLNGWKFMATEIQSDSYRCALENVTRNGLKDIITVLHVQDPNLLLEGVVNTHPCHDTVYDFCMCNPPFYSDENDVKGEWSRTGHRPVPHTRNTGNEVDTVTEGGEIKFIKRIVEDSLRLKTKIKWYTSLIGKKSSLKVITSLLKAKKIPVITSTEMVQGRTHRWGIAWSFDVTLDSFKTTEKRSQPYNIDLRAFDDDEEKANEWLVGLLNTLQIEYKRIDEEMCWYCKTSNNTWSKQRKRKRLIERIEKAREEGKKTDEMMEELRSMDTECLIEFKCWIERDELSREKKMKMSTSEISNDDGLLCCKFEWIDGTSSKDELHQIIQYIRNQLT